MPKFGETPATFTHQEAREIREAMGRSLTRVDCPRCGNVLTISDRIDRGGSVGASFEVRCEPCHRVAVVTEVPGTR
jgi:ribosomal protein S27E